ncbi:MAG TPA: sigma-54 dependent transcriptional regulator [Candidatus Kapabacteria bacterium]|nr:sigma-54 dependent transcriptional regulator [Candidatus Kapabacteria bacterium]
MADTEPTQDELGIIGRSEIIRDLVATMRRIAATDLTILLIGESGVGKEVFANSIHRLSPRASAKMLAINCGAIPETLLESELFGHERGAFTGAVEMRKGLFESADGGTVFLDEIGEMSLATQVKLLRVLETLEFTRVGSSEPRRTNVRVVAATNRDLEQDVERGTFRRDLYYRLRSAQLRIPPLRERREDIPLLFAHYAFQTAARLHIPFGGITPEALDLLVAYPWPGNIRELKNFVELAVTLERGEKITEEKVEKHLDLRFREPFVENPGALVHLGRSPEQAERELIYRALIDLRNEVGAMKQVLMKAMAATEAPPQPAPISLPALPPVRTIDAALHELGELRLDEMERRMIELALERHHGNRRAAAQSLGISERTLYRKLVEYKLKVDGDER